MHQSWEGCEILARRLMARPEAHLCCVEALSRGVHGIDGLRLTLAEELPPKGPRTALRKWRRAPKQSGSYSYETLAGEAKAWEDEQQALAREQELRQNEARLLHVELDQARATSRELTLALERSEANLAKAEAQRDAAKALAEHHRQRCAVLRAERIPRGWDPFGAWRDGGRVQHAGDAWEWEAWSGITKGHGEGTAATMHEACRAADNWLLTAAGARP